MNGQFQNHERDLWTGHQGDQPRGDSATWNVVDDQKVETSRTLHVVRAMCGILRHTGWGISGVDPYQTTRGHPVCIAVTGATRDEGQEEQCGRLSGRSVGAWRNLAERQPVNSKEGTERLRSSIERNPEERQRGVVLRAMRALREPVAAHSTDHGGSGSEDDTRQSHSALVNRETTGRDRTLLLSTRTREHDDAGNTTAESPLECSTCRTTSGLSLDGCDVRLGWRSFEGVDANMVPNGEDETMPLNVQGQLKYVDQPPVEFLDRTTS